MNKTKLLLGVALYLAISAIPIIVAHWRKHPHRWTITLVSTLGAVVCPVAIPCLIWACWPQPKAPPPIPARTYDDEYFN